MHKLPPERRARSHLFGSGIGLLATLAATAPAAADACPLPFRVLPLTADPVPRNTRVWVPTRPDAAMDYAWFDAQHERVPFSVVRIPVADASLDVLTPDAPLTYAVTYRVEACSAGTCTQLTEFRAGPSLDEEPPALPQVEERERVHKQGDASDDTRFVVFRVHGDTLNVADLDGTSGESPFSEGARLAIATRSEAVSLGRAQCLQQGFDDEHAEVRFGTFDLAGNFSGFTTPKPVELPGPPLLDSCALGPKAGGGWLAFVLGALLRRRLALRSRVK